MSESSPSAPDPTRAYDPGGGYPAPAHQPYGAGPPTGQYPAPQPQYPAPQYPEPQPQYPAPQYSEPPVAPPIRPGGPAPSAPPPPVRRARSGPILAVIATLSLLLCAGVVTTGVVLFNRAKTAIDEADPLAGLTDGPPLPTKPPIGGGTSTVVYEVDGEGKATSLTYTAENGLPKQLRDVRLPWRAEVKAPKGALYTVVAVRADKDSGELSCRLSVDGRQVASKEKSGHVSVVTCSSFNQN